MHLARWIVPFPRIDMSELIQLQSSLVRIFHEVLPAPSNWGNHNAVRELQKINKEMDGVSPAPSSASIAQMVAAYRRSQNLGSFHNLKYVCFGAAMQMPDGWCVLSDEKLCGKLLAEVGQLNEPRRRFKCFQALLSSYFTFALYGEQTSETAKAGWEVLRDWLAHQRVQFQRLGVHWRLRLTGWFGVLSNHENLLTNQPCDHYGADMLRGNNSSIEEARRGLGIPSDSWVMQEAILSQMKATESLGDDPFKTRLDSLLKLVQGQTEVRISDLLKRRSVAILVSRYARCTSKPEQPALRDAAVSIIGNPWLKKTQWDAWVKMSDGQPDDEARKMVNGWLKQRLITDFFDVLSEDGRADQRRLKYWLRFEPAIEDLWLVLGPDAMRNWSQPYRELRERAIGRLLQLENPGPSNNNAFIMRMGDWLIVEFGITGNACYVYPLSPSPFVLQGKSVSLYKLKNKKLGESHNHVANGWESNFDQAICPKVGYRPGKGASTITHHVEPFGSSRASTSNSSRSAAFNKGFNETEFWNQIKSYSLPTEDYRREHRGLWVNIEQSRYPMIDQWLESLGFKYKQGRGWWRE